MYRFGDRDVAEDLVPLLELGSPLPPGLLLQIALREGVSASDHHVRT